MRLQREMDGLHSQFVASRSARVYPPINIVEAEDGYHLVAELSGIDADSLDITVNHNEVILKGERPAQERADGQRYHRRERNFGKFSRAFTMPDKIDAENVSAKYLNGVLDITVPRAPETQPRKVRITG